MERTDMISPGTTLKDHLADYTRDTRIIWLSLMALLIGAFSTLTAYILVSLIALITNLTFFQSLSIVMKPLIHHHLGPWIIVVPAVGGLIIGLMARYGSDKIRGHGIPEALEAILFGQSKMSLKVAILKPLSSAISIGTGGPFGAEGPIIMTGGAVGSLFAQLFRLSAAERKTLLVAGAAGGMAAIFATPIAAVLLAVELLLFEWRPRSFIPVALSAAVASALRVFVLGKGPVFPVIPHASLGLETLGFALLIGLAAGLVSGGLTTLVYGFEDRFEKLPLHWMWWPAIGGLFVGLGGWLDPRVLGVGYENIHALLRGQLLGNLALGLLIGKALVWSIALGSGTSGGVLAPLLMVGGALGAVAAGWIPVGDPGLWALIGMAAVMGSTMSAPLTAMIFALELTHDVNTLPGLLIGCVAAHMVTVLMLRRSILTEKIARRGLHITREYGIDPLSTVRVSAVMDTTIPMISANMSLQDYAAQIAVNAPALVRHQANFILDENDKLAGILTRNDLLLALSQNVALQTSVLDIGGRPVVSIYPDELLSDAVALMMKYDIGRLAVVRREDPTSALGYLGRSAIIHAQAKRLQEETVRESIWIKAKPN
jgi:CIC family chloride channel protein